MKKRIALMMLLVAVFIIYYKPIQVEEQYSGYLYSTNNQVGQAVQIQLLGSLERSLVGGRRFKGSLFINEREVLLKAMNVNGRYDFYEMHILLEQGSEAVVYGQVTISKDFQHLWGQLDAIDEYPLNQACNFAAPSGSLEEAHNVGTAVFGR